MTLPTACSRGIEGIRMKTNWSKPRWLTLTAIAIAFLLVVSCGGSTSKPDFSFGVSPTSVTVGQGGTSESVVAEACGQNGFQGNATVTPPGLPPGATTQPSFPLQATVYAYSGSPNS